VEKGTSDVKTFVADLHTHTVASGHGADTMRVMCQSALKKGLKGIAITDHGPGIPGGPNVIYFMSLPRLARGIDLPIRIITGVEDDIKNSKGELTLPQEVRDRLEIVMAGCHPFTWISEQNTSVRTGAVVNAIVKGFIKVYTHPVGWLYSVELGPVLEAARSTHTALELNASKLENSCEIRNFLEKCAKTEVPIVVNSDAHTADEIGRFEEARSLLEEVDFPKNLIVNRSPEAISSFFNIIWKDHEDSTVRRAAF
jgi:putative hydrolase